MDNMPSKKRHVSPVEEEKGQAGSTATIRRSGRNRIKPQPYWKLKTPSYDHENTLIGVNGVDADDDDENDPFADPEYTTPKYDFRMPKLPKQKKHKADPAAQAKDEDQNEIDQNNDSDMVSFYKAGQLSRLTTIMGKHNKNRSKMPIVVSVDFGSPSGKNLQGFIQGSMLLPPAVLKKVEYIGCNVKIIIVLVFGVKNTIEITLGYPHTKNVCHLDAAAAGSSWLVPGKTLEISPGMAYWVKNHSSEHEALLKWVFVRNEF